MPRVAPRLGERVSRILRNRGWSQREAARRIAAVSDEMGADVSLSTLQNMAVGVVPGPEKILALALAAGENPDRLMGLAGYPFRYDPTVITEAEAEPDPRGLVGALALGVRQA